MANNLEMADVKSQIGREFFVGVGVIYFSTTLVRLFGGLSDDQLQQTYLLLLSSLVDFSIPVLSFFLRNKLQKSEPIPKANAQTLIWVSRTYPLVITLVNLVRVAPLPLLTSFSTYFTMVSSVQAIFGLWTSWILHTFYEKH